MRAELAVLLSCLVLSGCERRDAEQARVAGSFAAYSQCLLGKAHPDESVARRLRALALYARSPNAPATLQHWPARCEQYRSALLETIADSDDSHARKLRELLASDPSVDETDQLAAVFEVAREWGVHGGTAPTSVVAPPKLPLPLSGSQLAASRVGDAGDALDFQVLRSGPHRLLLRSEDPTRWVFCAFETSARCTRSLTARGHYVLLDAEPSAPPLVRRLGLDGDADVRHALTGKAAGPYVTSGWALADGSYVGVVPGEKRGFELIRVQRGEPERRLRNARDSADVVGPYLAVRDDSALELTPIAADGSLAEPKLELLGEKVVIVCQNDGRSMIATEGEGRAHAAFLESGQWSEPVSGELPASSFPHWVCGQDELSATWHTVDRLQQPAPTTIVRLACNAKHCTQTTHSGPKLAPGLSVVNPTVDLGTALALAWGGKDTPLRVAFVSLTGDPLEEVVVVDAAAHGGVDVQALALFARGPRGLLTFRDAKSSYAVWLTAEGKMEPVRIVR